MSQHYKIGIIQWTSIFQITNAWVKDPFEIQDSRDFNATEHEKFTDMASGSTQKLTFMKLSFVQFWCSIKAEYTQLSEKAKITFSFLNYIFYEAKFSSYVLAKKTFHDRLHVKVAIRIQVSSLLNQT